MEHPLVGDLSSLTLEQLQEKINEISKKLMIAHRTGNGSLVAQVQMAFESYQTKYKERLDEMYRSKNDDYQNKIDIS